MRVACARRRPVPRIRPHHPGRRAVETAS